jgi:hypothetical protein
LTGDLLCDGVANILAEELEPLWLAALLLRVLEAFGRYSCNGNPFVDGRGGWRRMRGSMDVVDADRLQRSGVAMV